VYDSLVERDREMRIVPALAVRWSQPEPTRWRFELRRGVRFHDGSPLTADDVVFSIERATQPTSPYNVFAEVLGRPVKIDDHTVELRQSRPSPLVLQQLPLVLIMSKAWTTQVRAERVPTFAARQEAHTTQHAMGTGRFIFESREPGVRSVLVRNPNWWGRFEGNVDRLEIRTVAGEATRTAALLAGDIDFTHEFAPQDLARLSADPRVKVTTGMENRLIFFGFDLTRDHLLYASVKGRNPFKDRRVREAFHLALHPKAIARSVMRDSSWPTSCFAIAPVGCMAPELESRQDPDMPRALKLMAEAGYPEGFDLTLDCPNDRYVADDEICQSLAAMLARINVKLQVSTRGKAQYFPKVQSRDTSFFMAGWGGSVHDAQIIMDNYLRTREPARRRGSENVVGVSDAQLDEWIEAASSEMNPEKRSELIAKVQRRVFDQKYYLVLHRQPLLWASRTQVRPVMLPSNTVRPDWFVVD
jgi:peptide/nickel transport system substrate-binding protein